MALPPLLIRVMADTRQAQAGLAGVQKSAFNWGTAMKVGGAVAAVAMAKFASSAVKAASDSAEAQNKANEIFGKSIGIVDKFAESSASSFGIAASQAHDMSAAFGQMFQTAGIAEKASANMSTRIVELAADMASFNNQDPSEMLQKLQSGLAGQARPLRQFGVFLSENRIKQEAWSSGIAAVGTELTDQEKILARYNVILQDTAKQQGDFARTVGESVPNQLRRAKAEFEDIKSEVGAGLIPAFTSLLGVVRSLMPALKALGFAFEVVGKAVGFVVSPLGSLEREFGIASDAAGLARVGTMRLKAAFHDGQLSADQVRTAVTKLNQGIAELGGGTKVTAEEVMGFDAATAGAASSAESFARGVQEAGDKARQSRKEIEDLANAQRSLSGGAIGLIGAFSGLQDAQARVNELQKAGKKGSREYREALASQVQAQIDLTSKVAEWQSAMNTAGASQRDVIRDVRQYAKDAGLSRGETKSLIDMIRKVPGKMTVLTETPGLSDAISSTIHWTNLIAGIPRHVSVAMQFRALNQPPAIPGRQHGGSVHAGRPYWVGERGPEVFVPPTSGRIEPNAGGTTTIQVFVDDERDFEDRVLAALTMAENRRRGA